MLSKERYYTEENIKRQAEEFLRKIDRKHIEFLPEKSSLIVLDMQKYFLDKNSHAYIPSAKAIIPKIKKLQDIYISKGLKVIQTRHLNTPDDAYNMGRWWKELITENNSLSAIVNELADEKIDIINKTQYDAFFKTDLEHLLKNEGIKQVVITGVMTHLCCETTARSAFMRGFDVFFTVDGTATYNRTFHLSTLINLSHGFAVPVTVDELLQQLVEENE